MITWEYISIPHYKTEQLDLLGSKGWEGFAATDEFIFLKRGRMIRQLEATQIQMELG